MTPKTIIEKLGAIRKVPQFFYSHQIDAWGMVQVKSAISAYKSNKYPTDEIDFIINSPGGIPDDAYRIIRALRSNFTIVNIIVPFWAKSAATLLSLGASKIIMDEYGEFGPLDIQLGKQKDDGTGYLTESALNDEHSISRIEERFKVMYESMYIRLYEHKRINIHKNELSGQILDSLTKFYQPLLNQINPYQLGEKKRKLDIGAQYAKRILLQFNADNITTDDVRKLVEYLVNGCPDHTYSVDYALIKPLMPKIVLRAKEFAGDEYEEELSNLSMLLIVSNLESTVCFLSNPYEIKVDEKTIENIEKETELTNFANPKSSKNGKTTPSRKNSAPKLN